MSIYPKSSKIKLSDLEELINGEWDGNSINNAGEMTIWTTTILRCHMFPNETIRARITGCGVSLWRGMTIEFDVEGRFDWNTKLIVLRKIHKGAYTNSVEYTGYFEPKTVSINGGYDNGTILLRKKKPAKVWTEAAGVLNGVWEGNSEGNTGSQTVWDNTSLKFNPVPPNGENGSKIFMIAGSGTTNFKGKDLEFAIDGTLNWDTKVMTLMKAYRGHYSNKVSYEALIWYDDKKEFPISFPKFKSDENPELCSKFDKGIFLQIHGSYKNENGSGKIHLRRVGPLSAQKNISAFAPMPTDSLFTPLSGSPAVSSPRLVSDHSQFTPISTVHVSGITSVPSVSSTSSSLCSLRERSSSVFHLPPPAPHQQQQMHVSSPRSPSVVSSLDSTSYSKIIGSNNGSSNNSVTKPLVPDFEAVANNLSGIYDGHTSDKDGCVSRWTETVIRFTSVKGGDEEGLIKIEGRGSSTWLRHGNIKISFSLIGTAVWSEERQILEMHIQKQHVDEKFSNRLGYIGTIESNYYVQDSSVTDCELSEGNIEYASVDDFVHVDWNTSASSSTAASVIKGRNKSSYPFTILELTRKGSLDDANLLTDDTDLKHMNTSFTEISSEKSAFEKYQIYLCGAYSGGAPTSKAHMNTINEFRNEMNLTQDDHIRAMRGLNFTSTDLKIIAANEKKRDNNVEADDDKCKICFVDRIDTVILPCGHFAICRGCGIDLTMCPICRSNIHRMQPIFRA